MTGTTWGGIIPQLSVPYSLTTAVRTLWYHTLSEKHLVNSKEKEKGVHVCIVRWGGVNSQRNVGEFLIM